MAIPLSLSNVPDATPYIQYVANNGQTVYPYPFPITQDSDLVVVINGVTQNTDSTYTLSGQGNPTGGNVTLNSGSNAGDIITLYRDIQIERLTQFAQNGGFSSSAFNAEFNNLYLIAQQLEASVAQCLQVPNTNNPAPTTTLTPAAYAGKYLAFDSYGNPAPAVLTSSGSITGAIVAGLLNALANVPILASLIRSSAESAANVFPVNYAYVQGVPDRYGNNTTPGTTDMTAALTAANTVWQNGGPAIALGPYTYAIASNLTLSAPITFNANSQIKPAAGVTVTLNGSVSGPNTKIFNLSNAGALIRGSMGGADVIDRWWGVVADGVLNTGAGTDNSTAWNQVTAFAAARANLNTTVPNRIVTLAGVYLCSSQVTLGDGITWQGPGKYSAIIVAPTAFANSSGLIAINGSSGQPTNFKGFAISGQTGGAGGAGLVCSKNGVFMSDLWVSAFTSHPGIIISSTDDFLTDWVCELNAYGVQVTSSDVTISGGKTYQSIFAGIIVSNGSSTDSGRVTISNCRAFGDGQNGFLVSAGRHVTFNACDAASNLNANMNVAGFQVDASTDVVLNGCTGTIATGASTAPGILLSTSSSDIVITGGKMTGFYDGLQANGAANLNVSGGIYSGNTRNGVLASAGGPVCINGITAHGNGAAGIDSENTAGSGYHNIVGNGCFSNGTYGILFNCGTTAATNAQANMARANTTAGYSFTGTTGNINEGVTPTND